MGRTHRIRFNDVMLTADVAMNIHRESILFLAIGLAVAVFEPKLKLAVQNARSTTSNGAMVSAIATSTGVTAVGAFAIMKLAEQDFSPFLYFQF